MLAVLICCGVEPRPWSVTSSIMCVWLGENPGTHLLSTLACNLAVKSTSAGGRRVSLSLRNCATHFDDVAAVIATLFLNTSIATAFKQVATAVIVLFSNLAPSTRTLSWHVLRLVAGGGSAETDPASITVKLAGIKR